MHFSVASAIDTEEKLQAALLPLLLYHYITITKLFYYLLQNYFLKLVILQCLYQGQSTYDDGMINRFKQLVEWG
jgi:hypothetical protein